MAAVRLLIVDDNDAYRAGMVRAATLHPDIDLVADVDGGAAGLTAIEEHRPDVALVDLRMPSLGGMELCRRLTGVSRPKSVQLVVLSAADEAGVRTEALRAGAVAFLTKDLPRKDILGHVVSLAVRPRRPGRAVLTEPSSGGR